MPKGKDIYENKRKNQFNNIILIPPTIATNSGCRSLILDYYYLSIKKKDFYYLSLWFPPISPSALVVVQKNLLVEFSLPSSSLF